MRSRRAGKLLWFAATVAIVFAVGSYRQFTQTGESVHFALNYPAEGQSAGGLGARGADGYLVVDVARTGLIKKILQPNVINLSTHWLHNAGDTPRRIRVSAEGFGYPIRWESTDKTWNEEQLEIGRTLDPGEDVTVDLFVTLPRPLPPGDVLASGDIVVHDADTGDRLTVFPVRIVRGAAAAAEAGDCCAP
ncbi:MAG: hypothetical protein OEV43_04930 [Coriobacteriia bacterium]|nr:hypothetical protein [Coriobacteriia bacterium]